MNKRFWKKTLSLLLILTMVLAIGGGCKEEELPSAQITLNVAENTVWFGAPSIFGVQGEEPADLSTTGNSVMKSVQIDVGDYDTVYNCRTLQGSGASMSFTLNGVTPNTVLTLDLEEVHQRTDGDINYTVYVNGTQVYTRSYDHPMKPAICISVCRNWG